MSQPISDAKYHVLTYVKHKDVGEEELVEHGVLEPERAGQAAEHPAFHDGEIQYTENYTCDGDKSTGGCTQTHGHAMERVRARLLGDDGQVKVVWRKFHPLVADGIAKPGQPFKAESDDAVQVRVEVRRILDDEKNEVFDDKSISMFALRQMQNDFTSKKGVSAHRMQLRSELHIFEETHLEAAEEQIEAVVGRLAALPNQDDVKAAADETRKLLRAVIDKAEAECVQRLKAPKIDANAAAQLKAQLQALEPEVQQVFVPLRQIEEAAKELLAFQDEIRQSQEEAKAVTALIAKIPEQLPTFDGSAINIAPTKKALDKLLDKSSKPSGLGALPSLREELKALRADLDGLQGQVVELEKAEQAKKDRFDAKVRDIALWRDQPDVARAEVLELVDSGGMLAGFGVAYWKEEAQAVLNSAVEELPALEALQYHVAADQKKLEAATKKLGPIGAFMDRVSAEMKKRCVGVHQALNLSGVAFNAPSAMFKIDQVNNGLLTGQARLQNNDDKPVRLRLMANGQAVQDICLSGKGRTASFPIQNLAGPISLAIVGVGAEAAKGEAGAAVALTNVDAESSPLPIAHPGLRYIAPYTFTPAPDQPVGQAQAQLEQGAGVVFATRRIPGV